MRRRPDPYAILDEAGRRHPLRSVAAALLVLVLFLLLLAYVAKSMGDDQDERLPTPPGNNQPGQP